MCSALLCLPPPLASHRPDFGGPWCTGQIKSWSCVTMGKWPSHSELPSSTCKHQTLLLRSSVVNCSGLVSLALVLGADLLVGCGLLPTASIRSSVSGRSPGSGGCLCLTERVAPGAASASDGCVLVDSYPSSLSPAVLHGSARLPGIPARPEHWVPTVVTYLVTCSSLAAFPFLSHFSIQ